MVDNNGTDYNEIGHIYGKKLLGRSAGCHWNFKQCVNRQMLKLPVEIMQGFKRITFEFCDVSTIDKYSKHKGQLDMLDTKVSSITS